MKNTLYMGIDPGITGAVALIDEDGKVVSLQETPIIHIKKGKKNKTVFVESQMVTLLEAALNSGTVKCAGLENVHSMPGQGSVSGFSFGAGFGTWIGILAALRMPYERIEPTVWKKVLAITANADKHASVVRALQLFPCAAIVHTYRGREIGHTGKADALLLAEYVRRRFTAR